MFYTQCQKFLPFKTMKKINNIDIFYPLIDKNGSALVNNLRHCITFC